MARPGDTTAPQGTETLEQRVALWEAVAPAPIEDDPDGGIWVYEVGESAMME
jgi:hypothetical protein